MDTLGERIAFLRESKGLKQRELMNMLGFNNLSRFERNDMKPGIDIIIAISDFFNVSTDWLLKGKEISSVKSHQGEENILPSDIELLAKFHQLDEREQGRIEERIEMLLELAGRKSVSSSKHMRSQVSTNGDGREEAAAKLA
ncbi:helix-turn-helix domain-containing protein [Paenibacillus alvei]|uniref:Helix-turn-helix domain-containing protein n=1 Tax=Paenibacillus alvei TaxID=44250 RepID=A0ABT4H9D1_PAEAL|nr:helix-turn-helix transcriptional regulator [Paenibacillus alvei]MCY9765204.1 helix-turn-helix domain-containing protein [Paenibacillus alvei]MCY9771409.1 helix-turn-helix domain-containing protein [Paenibacillus alvei]